MIFQGERFSKKQQNSENMKNYVNSNNLAEGRLRWLHKKGGKYRQNNLLQNKYRDTIRKNLEKRRSKLKYLLHSENIQYENELNGLKFVDPEEKIEKMRQKYKSLKERNNKENEKELKRLKEMQFRQNAEELRLVDKKVGEYKTKIMQEIQILEKHNKLEDEFNEKMIYCELEKREMIKKDLENEKKNQLKIKKIQEKNLALKKQIQEIKLKRKNDMEKIKKEKIELHKKWARNDKEAQDKLERQKIINKRIADDVKKHNLLQKMEKENKLKNEREEDKFLLEKILERERILKELEDKQKENYKIEIRNFFKNMKNRDEEIKLNQELIDKLLKKELARQWKKRQDVWDREENARIELMKEVYKHRFDNIENKKKKKLDEKKIILKEKEEMRIKMKIFEKEENEIFLKEILKTENYRDAIVKQIKEKFLERQRELEKELEEERHRKLKEMEYQERIEEEKRKGELLLEEVKRLRNTIY